MFSLFSKFKRILKRQDTFPPLFSNDIDKTLAEIGKKSRELLEATPIHKRKKIIYLISYYQSKFVALIDAVNIIALQLRGVEVIPVRFSYFFQDEDIIFGGMYNADRFNKQYRLSYEEGKLLSLILQTKPIFIEAFLSKEEEEEAHCLTKNADPEDWENIVLDGLPIGEYSAYAVANMNNEPTLLKNETRYNQFKKHLENCYKLYFASNALFKTLQPPTVVSNVPFYYLWRIPCQCARAQGIDFFSYMLTERKNTVFWSKNSFEFYDSSDAWISFSSSNLYNESIDIVKSAIQKRKIGAVSGINYLPTSEKKSKKLKEIEPIISLYKRCVLFPCNVLVDAAVLRSSDTFSNISDMIIDVIDWFSQRPQYLLILKAHPGEKIFLMAGEEAFTCRLKYFLQQNNINLPKNILFIDYDDEISVYSLFKNICAVIAYSSSVCIDAGFCGIKSLSICKTHYSIGNFSSTPSTKEEFYKFLSELLESDKDINKDEIKKQAQMYYLLYYFIGSIDFKLFSGNDIGTLPATILFNSYETLMPGANKALDYICDCIIHNRPVFEKNRWPPITA